MAENKSEQIKLYILIGVAIGAAVIAYFRFVHKKKPRATAPPPTTSSLVLSGLPEVKIPEKTARWLETPMRESLMPVIRDIFTPLYWPKKEEPPPVVAEEEPKPKSLPPLKLTGTIVGGRKAMAIINDQFFRIGDWIGDYRIIKIIKNQVLLTANDHEIVLEVLGVSDDTDR